MAATGGAEIPRRELRVLVVDDDPAVADLIATFLEGADRRMSVTSETDPHDAMSAVRAEAPDAVVSDYHMPGMDGLTFLERVDEVAPETVLILQTSDEDDALERRVRGAGVEYRTKRLTREHQRSIATTIREAATASTA